MSCGFPFLHYEPAAAIWLFTTALLSLQSQCNTECGACQVPLFKSGNITDAQAVLVILNLIQDPVSAGPGAQQLTLAPVISSRARNPPPVISSRARNLLFAGVCAKAEKQISHCVRNDNAVRSETTTEAATTEVSPVSPGPLLPSPQNQARNAGQKSNNAGGLGNRSHKTKVRDRLAC